MKKLSYAPVVLLLMAGFLLLLSGYYFGRHSQALPWLVQAGTYTPADAAPLSAGEDTNPASLLPGEKISINTAPAAELTRLPGIGETRAAAIVAWREENGPFPDPEALLQVYGIGEATLEGIREYIALD